MMHGQSPASPGGLLHHSTGEAYDPSDKRFGEWIGSKSYMAWFSKMATGKSWGQHEDKEIAERIESEGKYE